MREKPEGVVLWHVDGLWSFKAFDVFVRKGFVRKYKKKFNWLYDTDCIFVEAFQETFPDYVYIGSEDDLHILPMNYDFPETFEVITFTFVTEKTGFLTKEEWNEEKEKIKEKMKEVIRI
jgi:hypothetical protein